MKIFRNKSIVHIFYIVLCFALAMGLSCNKQGAKAGKEAITTFVAGSVTVTRPGKTPVPLKVKDTVGPDSVIITKDRSTATIQIKDTGIVRIVENSTMKISEIMGIDGKTTIDLSKGSVFSKVLKNKGVKYGVKTSTMVASVRGTEFLTTASETDTRVLVREGSVNVATSVETKGKVITENKNAIVSTKGMVLLSDQSRKEKLILEKYSLHPYIEKPESKNAKELAGIFSSLEGDEKKINEEIDKAKEEEKLSPLDRLRKAGKPLVKLFLKDGSQLIGSIEESTATGIKLNTGETTIDIPKNDIKRRVPTK